MNIVFFGTSKFAADILKCLINYKLNIVAVVTRTDKPKGRSLKVSPPPVKEFLLQAEERIPLLQPVKASTPEFVEEIKKYSPDLFIVAAYGEIIKTFLLDLPPLGAINVHGSLLPKYRGAAPIQRSLMNGDQETGVTIMKMVLEMDAGDMLAKAKVAVPPNMNFGELEAKLAEISCEPLRDVICQIESGSLQPVAQDRSQVTFADKIKSEETQIIWGRSAHEIHNLIRALSPHPGAWCWLEVSGERKRMKVKKSEVALHDRQASDWIVPCGKGELRLVEVQLEGKKSLPAHELLRGLRGLYKIL